MVFSEALALYKYTSTVTEVLTCSYRLLKAKAKAHDLGRILSLKFSISLFMYEKTYVWEDDYSLH